LANFVGVPIDSPIRILALFAFNLGLPLACLALTSAAYFILRGERLALYLSLGAVIPPLLLAAISPYIFAVDRYVFAALPCWILLAAWGLQALFQRIPGRERVLAAGVLLLLLADSGGAVLMYHLNHGNRPDWRAAQAYVGARQAEGDVVVSSVPEVVGYYAGIEIVALRDIDPAAIVSGSTRYWFIIDAENGWWAGRQKLWVEEHAQLMEMTYLRVREYMHLRIYVYDPARAVLSAR
jgi:hypothetical protein